MHGLSPSTIRLANSLEPLDPSNLPVRTLLRGARAGLPSGQEVADSLFAEGKIKSGDRLTVLQLTQDTCDRTGSVLHKIGFEQNSPLFYYLLKEAEINAAGLTLGPIGSHIVSEVIQGALESDLNGYMSVAGQKWQMPLWHFANGAQRRVNSMIGIIQLVGDDRLLPECEAHWRRVRVQPPS